jgi:hypothetical protein
MSECIIITSVIETTNNPLSYSTIRSIYSHEERFKQTLETIESVRKYLPSVDIILVECSPPSNYMKQISEKVDYFFNLEFNTIVNNGIAKGKGEATLLLHGLSKLPKDYKTIYKLTGRYVLQPTFNKSIWNTTDLLTGCRTNLYGMNDSIHTFFYKIPRIYIDEFKKCLETYMTTGVNVCIENHIASTIKPINYVNHIGILVRWACYTSTPIF